MIWMNASEDNVVRHCFAIAVVGLSVIQSSAAANDQMPTLVKNNAGLKHLNGPTTSTVYRSGFAAAGDGGGAVYNWVPTNCSRSDDGAQVQPATGTGCWIADLTSIRPTPMIWGAKGNGVTDDTIPVQAAIDASPVLYTGNQLYLVGPLTVTKPTHLMGNNGPGGVYIFSKCATGFKAKATTETLLSINGDNSVIEHVCFQMGVSVNQQTAGAAILVAAADSVIIKENQINFPYIGIIVGGATDGVHLVAGHTQTNSTLVYSNVISQPSNGGAGIQIGPASTGASTVGTVLRDNSIPCFGTTAAGIQHYDSAGTLQSNPNGPYACAIGTSITPGGAGARQVAQLYTENDVLGDSSATHDLLIDTLTTNGVVFYGKFENSWAASVSTTDNSVLIQNTGRGAVKNLVFNNFTSHSGKGQTVPLMDIEAGENITISNSTFCADGGGTTTGPAIKVGASASNINITGNTFGSCFGTLTNGVQVLTGANILNIQGNDFGMTTNPLVFSPNSETAIVANNMGIDNLQPLIEAAATITLPNNPTVRVSGTATISTMNGTWSNRQVILLPFENALSFTTGGNICNPISGVLKVPLLALWDASSQCWHIK